MSKARLGFGGLLYMANDSSPESFTKIGEVLSIQPPKIKRDAQEVTHSESPEGWREFLAGLKDGGEASAEINFDPGSTGQAMITAAWADAQLSRCKITIPSTPAYRWVFDAVLTGFDPAQPIDDKMTATVTFKVSGKPVLEADS